LVKNSVTYFMDGPPVAVEIFHFCRWVLLIICYCIRHL